ncbi:MAG: energy transducer TonB [Ignavibacteriales bacterium]|nr:energy transducer TonB [Ignavibacteriales bacterium]
MKIIMNYNKIFFSFFFFTLFLSTTNRAEIKNTFSGEDDYLLSAEKMPTPVGGFEGIMKKISYPEMAQRTKTEGKVYVLIYVNEKGDVDDVKIVKGIGYGCDEEAVKAIKKTKFTPGVDKGVSVKAKFSLALTFKLS